MFEVEPVRLTWELESPASVEDTWALFSDTDRFNRSVGLNFSFEETPLKDGSVRRIGSARFLGLKLRWDELPFQYRENQWYRTRRIFHSGPAREYTVICRVRPTEHGSSIRYTVEVIPRSLLTRPVVALELRANTQPRLDRGLKGLLGELVDAAGAIDPPPPPLEPDATQRLSDACAQIEPAGVGRRLREHIEGAPLYQQSRMAPLALAEAWGIPEQDMILGFLSAVHGGALSLRWDLLCPLCRAPKQREARLSAQRQVHCPSCNIYYDGTFPDSVAVSFQTASAIRDFQVPVECIGSPGRQRQVVAQDTLAHEVDGRLELGVSLREGLYRIRTWPQRETAILEVRPGASPTPLALTVTPEALAPARLVAEPGPLTLVLSNSAGRPIDVILESVGDRGGVLTAGRLLEIPQARALLSPELVAPDFAVESQRAAVLVVSGGRGVLRERLKAHGALGVYASERAVVAIYLKTSHALRAAADLSTDPSLRCVVSAGPVLELTVDGQTIPLGRTVEDALAALSGAHPCEPAIPVGAAADPEVRRALAQEGARVTSERCACTPVLSVRWLRFDTEPLDT